MKKVLSSVIAGALVATVGLAAQSPQPPSSPASPPSRQAPDSPSPTGTSGRDQAPAPGGLSQAAGMVTIAGCIENAPPSAAAAPGAAAGAASPQRFVLANAKSSAPSASPSSAVGTSGTTASRYELDGQSAELTKHLNHQVEITGTVQPASAGAAAGAAAAAPKLMVSSVKMVSATCTK